MGEIGQRPSLLENLVTDLAGSLRASAADVVDADRLRYRADPVAYLTEVLRLPRHTLLWSEAPGFPADHAWDGTRDPFAEALRALARGDKKVGIESGTGTGKTVLLAAIVCWFLDCWPNALVVTIAPKEDQLKLHLWKELNLRFWDTLKSRRPTAERGTLKVRVAPPGEAWAAIGFAVGVGTSEEAATKAQGFHAEHMLIIVEETPGVKGAVMAAFANTCTAPHNLRIAVGNPDHAKDALHLFCTEPGATAIRVSSLDHPNVVCDDANLVPGAVSRDSVEDKLALYGERGNLFLSRVRGISPAQAADALIRYEWCEAAVERGYALAAEVVGVPADARPGEEPLLSDLVALPRADVLAKLKALYPDLPWDAALGVDVANSKSGDEAAIARGLGPACLEVEAFPCEDANALGSQVGVEIRERGIDPDYVGVDSIGVGAGTVNELLGDGHLIQALNAGTVAMHQTAGLEEFLNLRAEMWWLARQDLEAGRVALPDDAELVADLCTPRWTTRSGKIVVQKKEELRKQLGRSPNKGDAFVMWNWARQVRSEAATVGGASDVSF